MGIKFSFLSKTSIISMDAIEKISPDVFDTMVKEAGFMPSKVLYIQTSLATIPTNLVLACLKQTFKEGACFANGSVTVWNGSFHASEYNTVGKPGDYVVFFPKRKVKHVFSRVKKAVARAEKDWDKLQLEAACNHLVRKGVWRREGD